MATDGRHTIDNSSRVVHGEGSTVARRVVTRSSVVRIVADLLRVSGAVSLAWALLEGQWVNAALFALVLGGLMLPRMVPTLPVLDLSYTVVLMVAAWSAVGDLYVTYDWLDVAVHAAACGLVAGIAYGFLVMWSALPALDDPGLRRAGLGAVVVIWAVGIGLGVLWEAGEWFGHTYLDRRIQVGYNDTVADLMADALGALVAGLLVVRAARAGSR